MVLVKGGSGIGPDEDATERSGAEADQREPWLPHMLFLVVSST